MRKLNKREKILIYVLGGGIAIYGFMNYLYQPLTTNIADKEIRLSQLKSQSRDVLGLEQKQKEIQKQNVVVVDMAMALKDSMNLGTATHQEVVTYVGSSAALSNVSVISLKELDTVAQDGITKIPYEVVIEGKYPDITSFADSLYKFTKYVYVDGIYMKNIYKIPMTDKVTNGSSQLASGIQFTWGKGFMTELDKQIPGSMLKPTESTTAATQLPIVKEEDKMKKVIQIRIRFGMLAPQ